MSAAIALPRAAASLGRPLHLEGQEGASDPRTAALADFDRRMNNLTHCVHWLVDSGISVTETRLCRRGGIVIVAPSPWLLQLFDGDCSWRKRRQDGALTIFTWFAVRFGTRIEWEQVTCA